MDNHLPPDTVGVGIVTRDRWETLRTTLRALQALGFSRWQTIVLDDASQTPCPPELISEFPWVRFLRDETNRGLVVQRNRVAELLTTRLWLEVDDDSYPVAGSLAEAVHYLLSHPKVACLALRIIEKTKLSEVQPGGEPFPVQRFVGCAALINREIFLTLNGYRENFLYFGEEGDFCARALDAGFATVYFPALIIRHDRSPLNRNTRKIAFYQGRNRWLLAWWNFPLPDLLGKLFCCLPGTLALVKTADYPNVFLGLLNGIYTGLTNPGLRHPMTRKNFRLWNSLDWKAADR